MAPATSSHAIQGSLENIFSETGRCPSAHGGLISFSVPRQCISSSMVAPMMFSYGSSWGMLQNNFLPVPTQPDARVSNTFVSNYDNGASQTVGPATRLGPHYGHNGAPSLPQDLG
ncbi:hypothetical protein GOBAR_AA13645 [Gossypium barbadense]|uniref:Uncharacterized protein n=1 Tax=Gossypium barbadense TaxID=3634 RepID=A0A2P5XUG4_GOSBA|nr:hypothetical protein GOBAR_AA13645 [Gossypium barbadense]